MTGLLTVSPNTMSADTTAQFTEASTTPRGLAPATIARAALRSLEPARWAWLMTIQPDLDQWRSLGFRPSNRSCRISVPRRGGKARHRIVTWLVGSANCDEAEFSERGPAKLAPDSFQMSSTMRSCFAFTLPPRNPVSLDRRRQRRFRCESRRAAVGSHRVPLRYPTAQFRAVKPELLDHQFRRATAVDDKLNSAPSILRPTMIARR